MRWPRLQFAATDCLSGEFAQTASWIGLVSARTDPSVLHGFTGHTGECDEAGFLDGGRHVCSYLFLQTYFVLFIYIIRSCNTAVYGRRTFSFTTNSRHTQPEKLAESGRLVAGNWVMERWPSEVCFRPFRTTIRLPFVSPPRCWSPMDRVQWPACAVDQWP